MRPGSGSGPKAASRGVPAGAAAPASSPSVGGRAGRGAPRYALRRRGPSSALLRHRWRQLPVRDLVPHVDPAVPELFLSFQRLGGRGSLRPWLAGGPRRSATAAPALVIPACHQANVPSGPASLCCSLPARVVIGAPGRDLRPDSRSWPSGSASTWPGRGVAICHGSRSCRREVDDVYRGRLFRLLRRDVSTVTYVAGADLRRCLHAAQRQSQHRSSPLVAARVRGSRPAGYWMISRQPSAGRRARDGRAPSSGGPGPGAPESPAPCRGGPCSMRRVQQTLARPGRPGGPGPMPRIAMISFAVQGPGRNARPAPRARPGPRSAPPGLFIGHGPSRCAFAAVPGRAGPALVRRGAAGSASGPAVRDVAGATRRSPSTRPCRSRETAGAARPGGIRRPPPPWKTAGAVSRAPGQVGAPFTS